MDLEYANAIAKHRQADKNNRPTPITFSPYPHNNTTSTTTDPSLLSTNEQLGPSPRTGSTTSPNPFSPTFTGSNLAPAVSKLRRTSQFFSKWTHSFVKPPSGVKGNVHRYDRGTTEDYVDHEPPIIIRSQSEYEPTLLSDGPPDLRRDSMYSVRTSATAPVGLRSCPSSPGSSHQDDTVSLNIDGDVPESFLTALKSFNQLQPETEPTGDFQQLRDALHNFSMIETSYSQRKNSAATHQTADTSESELDMDPVQVAINHARTGLAPRHPNQGPLSGNTSALDLGSGSDAFPIDDQSTLGDLSPTTRAHRLFNNPSQLLPTTEVAEYLGSRGTEAAAVRSAYMDHFSFSRLRLDEAFRNMCTHLYLRGETQVIDRILSDFARRYWDCNPDSVFGSQDVVYAVSYSMLLLNTDLHVARNHSKMTRGEFVRNTMSAIDSCVRSASLDSDRAGSVNSTKLYNQDEVTSTLKEMYTSIKQQQILQHIEPSRSSLARRTSSAGSPASTLTQDSGLYRAQSVTRLNLSTGKPATSWELQRQKSGNSLNQSLAQSLLGSRPDTPDLFFNATKPPPHQPPAANALVNPTEAAVYPYIKTGLLVRKHLYERTDKKAPHRTWKDCLVSVEGGDLRMYKVDRFSREITASRNPPIDPSLLLGTVTLRHCLAVTLPPPGYSASRPHVFALQLPSGGVYLFQAAAADHVSAWVVICNFWAARESKEPLPGGITSIDYGWGTAYEEGDPSQDPDETDVISAGRLPSSDSHQPISSRQLFNDPPPQPKLPPTIQEWHPPALPMVRSVLEEDAQLGALLRQISALDNELVDHMELRSSIHRRMPPRSPHYAKAFSNWERKSQYLLRELIKYQTYADILKRTLAANRGLTNLDDLLDAPDPEIEDVTEFVPGDLGDETDQQPSLDPPTS